MARGVAFLVAVEADLFWFQKRSKRFTLGGLLASILGVSSQLKIQIAQEMTQ